MADDKLIEDPEVTLSLTVILFLFRSPVMEKVSFPFYLSWKGKKLISAENEFSISSSSREHMLA